MKLALEKANLFALSYDEAISIDNQYGFPSMHISFKTRQGSLHCYPLKHIVDGFNATNLTLAIM